VYIRLGQAPSPWVLPPPPFVPVPPLKLTRVTNTQDVPYRYVCRIVTRAYDKGGASVGTGVLIGPFHVLTCAHVIYPLESPHTGEIDVFPAQNGPDENSMRFRANGWAVSPAWQPANCFTAGEDYGLIRLATATRQGFMPIRPFDPARLRRDVGINLAGYPATREEKARHMYESRGAIWGEGQINGCVAGEPQGPVVRATAMTQLLIHDLDSAKSESGGPMWSDDQALVAIHAGVIGDTWKKAIFLNEAVRNRIQEWMTKTLPPPGR